MSQLATTEQPGALVLVDDVSNLVEPWLEHCHNDGRMPATLTAYRKGLDVFTTWLQETGHEPGDLQARDVLEFKGYLSRRYSAQTVNLRLSAVRSFYRWAVLTKRLPVSPAESVQGVRRPNSRRHMRDRLANGEVNAVLATCDPGTLAGVRNRAIITLMAFCGLRAVEIHRANIGNLKTEDDRLVLEVQGKGRTAADEIAVIPYDREAAVREWRAHRLTFAEHGGGDPLFVSLSNRNRGQRISLRVIRGMVMERYRAAGVMGDRKSTHSLRHSAITSAIRHGATPLQVQAMGRHGSFDTTLGYFHELGRTADPAEDLIDYG